MSSPIGYPQGNAYPMFSSASAGDNPVAVGKEKSPLYSTTSSDGGVDLVFGPDTVQTVGLRTTPLRGAFFGDSIAEQTPSGPHDIELIAPVFPVLPTSGTSYGRNMTLSAVRNYYPLVDIVGDGGIMGQTVGGMLARDTAAASASRKAISDLIDLGIDFVILSAGSINNLPSITAANYASVVQTVYDNHIRIIERFRTARVTVIDDGFFGYSSGGTDPDLVRKALLELNSKYASYAKSVPGVIYIDHALKDAAGYFLPNMSVDGVHPNMQGGRVRGKAHAKALTLAFGKCASVRFRGQNLAPNPLFAATGAYGSGVMATGITVGYGNCTLANAKIESRSGRLFQTIEATPTAPANVVAMTLTLDPTIWNKSAGDVLGWEVDILLESLDGASGPQAPTDFFVRLDIKKTGAGRVYIAETASYYKALSDPVDAHVAYKIKLPEASSVIESAVIYLKYQTNGLVPYRIGIGAPRII